MSAWAALAVSGLLLAAPEAPPRVVVIVQGAGAEAGVLQKDLERELIAKGAQVRTGAELVSSIGAPAEAVDAMPAAVQKAKDKIGEAEAAFLRGELEIAKAAALEARRLLSEVKPVEIGFDQRVAASLWLAATLRDLGDPRAQTEVRDLLLDLDPTVTVSPDVFPPEFVTFVATERRGVKTSTVQLTELPGSAQIWVNGRRIESNPFAVVQHPAGKPNRLTVRAPGYRTVEQVLPAVPPKQIRVPMAIAPRAELDVAVRALLSGKGNAKSLKALDTLLSKTRSEAAVIVQTGKSPRAILWRGAPSAIRGGSASTIAMEVIGTMRRRVVELLRTTAGLEVSLWQRRLGDGVYSLPLSGSGPHVTAELNYQGALVLADLSWVSYGITPIEANVTQGDEERSPLEGEGGNALRGVVAAGYGVVLGGFQVGALAGARHESYSMKTLRVRTSDGDLEPLLGSHTWTAPEARLRGVYDGGAVRVHAALGAAFGGSYSEDPGGTSGTKPKPGTTPFWQLGASLQLGRATSLGLTYAGEIRTVQFAGKPRAERSDPDDEDLALSDVLSAFTLSAAYRF